MDVSAFTSGAGDAEADLLGVLVVEPPELGASAHELDEALGARSPAWSRTATSPAGAARSRCSTAPRSPARGGSPSPDSAR